MASTYVVVKDAKKAAEYFNAGAMYYLWGNRGTLVWEPQTIFGPSSAGPTKEELLAGYWAILVEEDDT